MLAKNIVGLLIASGLPLILTCCGHAEEPRSEESCFYVAPWGNDGWSGTLPETNAVGTDGPFATLPRAREAMRKSDRDRARKVLVRGGAYFFDETFSLGVEDSGTQEHPAVWQAAPGEEVRLVGGRTLQADAFCPVTDAKLLSRLDPAARDKVLQADLVALKIPVGKAFPISFRGPHPAMEFFFNDRRMTLARWPNEGWATIAKIVESGSRPRDGDLAGRPGVFEYSGDQPARWNVESGVWLNGYWCYNWSNEVIRVKTIDREKHRITLAAPHVYGVKKGNPSPRRFCAMNLLEELDQPGEYYIDHSTGMLFFWPPATLNEARMVLATLDAPVVALQNASNIVLRGFIVEASHGDGLAVSGGSANRIQACEVRNIRQMGIRVDGGTNHRVEACDIHDTGAGGLRLAGGERKTLTPAHHEAINNHIWRFSQLRLTAAYAIHFGGVGNRAAHNLIHDAPHQAIFVGGNDHVFEYNVVHNVCMSSDDCGALYKGRNPSCRGNLICYNFWHHIGNPMGHGNCAVYFDDGDGGDTVFGNVFFRCGEPGKGTFGTVFSHGGHDILAENNIFIECKRALGSSPWNDQRWRKALDGWDDRLLKKVDVTRPPYATRYPSLAGFLDFKPGQKPRINRATRNVIVMCTKPPSGNWQVRPEENWSVDHDPGFVDAAHGNFQLKSNSEVFARLPGFQPIPFQKIGLYADELRPKPPVETWPDEPLEPLPLSQKK